MKTMLHAVIAGAVVLAAAAQSVVAQPPSFAPSLDFPEPTAPSGMVIPNGSATPDYATPDYATPDYATPDYPPPGYGGVPNYGALPQPGRSPIGSGTAPSALPGYGGPMYGGPGPYAGGELPVGTFNRQDFPPQGVQPPPQPASSWVSTFSLPLGARVSMRGGRGPGCEQCSLYSPCNRWFDNIAFLSAIEAFKGPIDLNGNNANFGKKFGLYGAVPLSQAWGVGLQFGATAAWYDWLGSQYSGSEARFQNFTTLGLFQRLDNGVGYGFVYDWLYDDFYTTQNFSQFRLAASWQINCKHEIGVWGTVPYRQSSVLLGNPASLNTFQSMAQGNVYWRHIWSPWAWTSTYMGFAEAPGLIPFGTSAQVAINDYMAVVGNYEYILPQADAGAMGRSNEIWNVTIGFLFYPGTARQVATSQYRPLLDMANNANFALLRK